MGVRRSSMIGAKNPNFKNAGWHVCDACGETFHSYVKTRRFCSRRCAGTVTIANIPKRVRKQPSFECTCVVCGAVFTWPRRKKYCEEHQAEMIKARASRLILKPKPLNTQCNHCGKLFFSYRASRRKYCSYACHLASGGAIRAGLAALAKTSIYGAKKDANHKEIIEFIQKAGAPYIDLSPLGCGVPDVLVEVRGSLQLWEIKNINTSYGKKGLNKNQKAWAEKWKGVPVRIIYNVDDALKSLGVEL